MLVAGGAAAAGGWWALRAPLANPVLCRPNYRGEQIPTAIGIVAALAYVAVVAASGLLDELGWTGDAVAAASRRLVLPAVLGFALLGLFDDLAGSGHHRGFRGHAAELRAGRVTTGMLKLAGGGLVAVAVVAGVPRPSQPALAPARCRPGRPGRQPGQPLRPGPRPHDEGGAGRPGGAGRRRRAGGPSWPVRRWPPAPAPASSRPSCASGGCSATRVPNAARRRASGLGPCSRSAGRRASACSSRSAGPEPGQRAGELQPGDRRHPAVALVRPPRPPPPVRSPTRRAQPGGEASASDERGRRRRRTVGPTSEAVGTENRRADSEAMDIAVNPRRAWYAGLPWPSTSS